MEGSSDVIPGRVTGSFFDGVVVAKRRGVAIIVVCQFGGFFISTGSRLDGWFHSLQDGVINVTRRGCVEGTPFSSASGVAFATRFPFKVFRCVPAIVASSSIAAPWESGPGHWCASESPGCLLSEKAGVSASRHTCVQKKANPSGIWLPSKRRLRAACRCQ